MAISITEGRVVLGCGRRHRHAMYTGTYRNTEASFNRCSNSRFGSMPADARRIASTTQRSRYTSGIYRVGRAAIGQTGDGTVKSSRALLDTRGRTSGHFERATLALMPQVAHCLRKQDFYLPSREAFDEMDFDQVTVPITHFTWNTLIVKQIESSRWIR